MHCLSECWPATLCPTQSTQKSDWTFDTVINDCDRSLLSDTVARGGRAWPHCSVGRGVPSVGTQRRRAVPPLITGSLSIGRLLGSGLTRSTLTTGGSSGKQKSNRT